MALKSIDIRSDNIEQALTLLDKGFPVHGIAFWRSMLARISQMHKRQGILSHGELLLHGSDAVGVLLKIQHQSPSVAKPIVNLSSWYVEPKFRWYAPRMLLKAISDKDTIYTDLSPSPEVYSLNEKLGFKTITSGRLFCPLPLTAIQPATKAKIYCVDQLSSSNLEDDLHRFIIEHRIDKSQTLVIEDGERLRPTIFQLRKKRGLTCANLIYTQDLKHLQQHTTLIARRLLGKGIALMTMPSLDDYRPKGTFRLNSFKPQQVKGEWHENMVDQTYSEATLLPYQI